MRRFVLFLMALAGTPANGQLINPSSGGSVDLSPYATKAEVSAATAPLATTSALSAVSAAIPVAASTIPNMETVGGAVGTAGTYRPGNAAQPRITRSVAFTTGAAGTVAVTWADIGTTSPLVFPIPNVASGATQGPLCYPVSGTISATGATIKCFTTQTVTVSILGAVVAPLTTAGSGVTGQVIAIPPS